jgi:hypothetical protein
MISGDPRSNRRYVRVGQRVAVGLKVSLSGTSGTGTPLSRQLFILAKVIACDHKTYCGGLVGVGENLLPDFL